MTVPPSSSADVSDQPGSKPVLERVDRVKAAKWSVVTDRVQLDADTVVNRDVVVHPGAVGVVALDERERVVMLRQYRHPVASQLWEIPAGLLDEPGESLLATAQRELVEEVGLVAAKWHRVIDLHSSPGMSSETIRVFLARGLTDVDPALRPLPTDEERDLVVVRVGLDDLVERVIGGHIRNSLAVAALLAVAECRRAKWRSLRPPEYPWPAPSWGLG
ncbi:MAG TPA: NUDIX hydrolase [Actinomycetes bacterium]|nr:NUDIX hydrolase [Actinomycetes bacterium]